MTNTAQTQADKVVDALDRATKDFSLALFDPEVAREIRENRGGDVAACWLRLQNDNYEMTKGTGK